MIALKTGLAFETASDFKTALRATYGLFGLFQKANVKMHYAVSNEWAQNLPENY